MSLSLIRDGEGSSGPELQTLVYSVLYTPKIISSLRIITLKTSNVAFCAIALEKHVSIKLTLKSYDYI